MDSPQRRFICPPSTCNGPLPCTFATALLDPARLRSCFPRLPSWSQLPQEVAKEHLNIFIETLSGLFNSECTVFSLFDAFDHFEASTRTTLPTQFDASPGPSFFALLADATLHEFQHIFLSEVSPYSIRTSNDHDPRATLTEIAEIHASGAPTVLTFEVALRSKPMPSADLLNFLPPPLRCHHFASIAACLSASTLTGAPMDTLRELIDDVLLAPMDHRISDTGVGYVRKGRHGLVAVTHDEQLANVEYVVRAHCANIGADLVSCTRTYVASPDALASVTPDLVSLTVPKTSATACQADQVVYVGRDGARVSVGTGRLMVTSPQTLPELSVPTKLVSRIVLSGNVGFSAGARSWALRNQIPVTFLSRRGSYLGQLVGSGLHGSRLLRQVELAGNRMIALPIAQGIVQSKLRQQVYILQKLARRSTTVDVSRVCGSLRNLALECQYCGNHAELMGVEGAASELYFSAIPEFLPPEVRFSGRSRRPPQDLANAALSYGYAILLSECIGALVAAGLEPSLGVLHSVTDKRPSLALDLMEEFRPLLVDRTVFSLLRSRRLRAEHGIAEGEGVWLVPEGKKILTSEYEKTLQRSVRGALPGFAGSWRRHIGHEAQLLARAIMDPSYRWVGVVWR